MKIEFEISDNDVDRLVKALQLLASQATEIETFEVVQKLLNEIQNDVENGVAIFNHLITYLKPYTNGTEIAKTSKLILHLGISENFINSSRGLIHVLKYILGLLVAEHKPAKKPVPIPSSEINDLSTIEDCINLIQEYFEKS